MLGSVKKRNATKNRWLWLAPIGLLLCFMVSGISRAETLQPAPSLEPPLLTPEPDAEIVTVQVVPTTPIPAAPNLAEAQPSQAKGQAALYAPVSDEEIRQTEQLESAAEDLYTYEGKNRIESADIEDILSTLPEDLDLGRTLLVVKAYSLLGKIPYEWGGKSSELGWDMKWGTYKRRTIGGQVIVSKAKYGLDCSGFVRWCFINASGTLSTAKKLGSGTYKQWLNSDAITWQEALPGDLVFTNPVGRRNHDGIIVSVDENGDAMVIHCVRGKGVVLESAKDAKFKLVRRPKLLSEQNDASFQSTAVRHRNSVNMADLRYLLALKEW